VDFAFDETQEDCRRLARSILDERASLDRIKQVEANEDHIDRELWAELASADLLGLSLPAEVGGSGLSLMELCVVLEEAGRRVAPVPLLATLGMAALPIAHLGDADQRKRLLAPVVDGSSLLTAALEESVGHDPLSPATTATRDASRWRLDGTKIGVPIAPVADSILVSARTAEGPAGLFLIDPRASGVSLEPAWSTHRQVQANVVLDGAVVEAEDVLAIGDDAMRIVHQNALACTCAVACGVLEEALRITASYISEREQFGKPIAAFQGATLRAADAYIDTEAVRVTTWSAIWRVAAGRPADEALAIAKFWVADGGQRVVHACQHLHGGIGVDIDYPIHRYFLWAKELELALGGATPQLLAIGAGLAGDA
jgi:alkylation response protein AidB-like acyl-CoA dehydrogenase